MLNAKSRTDNSADQEIREILARRINQDRTRIRILTLTDHPAVAQAVALNRLVMPRLDQEGAHLRDAGGDSFSTV